ncbi:MAG TPA: hypothetical protein VG326_14310 [Tepidisphaeraceae bacterium]|nr:hypothetical protein [Tepidisphaeraceae bacterium]
MRNTKHPMDVTYQKGRGLYKICCGRHEGEAGNLLPTIHWLGKDEDHARHAAGCIRKAWSVLTYTGRDRWTKDDLRKVLVDPAIVHARRLDFDRTQARQDRTRRLVAVANEHAAAAIVEALAVGVEVISHLVLDRLL